jgi:hypothetical protein
MDPPSASAKNEITGCGRQDLATGLVPVEYRRKRCGSKQRNRSNKNVRIRTNRWPRRWLGEDTGCHRSLGSIGNGHREPARLSLPGVEGVAQWVWLWRQAACPDRQLAAHANSGLQFSPSPLGRRRRSRCGFPAPALGERKIATASQWSQVLRWGCGPRRSVR